MSTREYINCPLTPALLELLAACAVLKTTETKALAAHLNRSPATVRTEFQRIFTALGVHCRYAALKTAEEQKWLRHGTGGNEPH